LQNALPEGKFIRLTWLNYGTNAIAGFAIYRKLALYFNPTHAQQASLQRPDLSVGYVEVRQ
jgi:hypothetical protein